jgi:hypothetical protein
VRLVLVVVALAACQRTESAKPADCSRVAETLASFEVGNYATPEQRAPAVAKHKAACESTKVTADEATCLGAAKDTWAAKACLPRMFPPQPANAGCATVAARMRAAVMAQVGSGGSAAEQQLDKLAPVIQTACEQDSWPGNVVKCIVDGKPGDMNVFTTCTNQLPKEHQDKLAQRLQAALQPK